MAPKIDNIIIRKFEIIADETNRRRNSDDSSGDHSYTEYCEYHSSWTVSNATSTSKEIASREREEVSQNMMMRTQTPQSFFPLSFLA